MVRLLLDYYRKYPNDVDINWRDCRGFTVLHSAVVVKDQLDDILFELMQFDGIDFNPKNQDDNTPLHYFCTYSTSLNCRLIGQELIKRGASVTAQNKNGETPLHKAIFNNKVRLFLVEMLLSKNAPPNAPNNDGDTPLHYAVRLYREDLVETLIKGGANVTIKNKQNKTPADLIDEYSRSYPNPVFLNIKKLFQNVTDLMDFLVAVEMEEYFDIFVKQGLYVPELLCSIDEMTLESMGIPKLPMGKQIKFFRELEALKAKIENPKKGHSGSKELKADVMAHSTDGTSADVRQRLEFVGDGEINSDEVEYTKELGSGSSGKVYKALWRGKEVAVKVLSNVNLEAQIEEFKKEFKIMNEVKSPYMIQFYGVSLKPLSMIMEYCARGSLYHVLNDKTLDIGWERALGFALDMARGINTLHTWKTPIVHRDLKSLNLLVNSEWRVKVADFGLSRFTTGTNLETFKKLCGTFAYCAPEIFGGFSFTTKSDVYSMGIVLWELITRVMKGYYEQPFSEYKQLHFDFQILVQAASGLRPTLPKATPQPLVDLFKACTEGKPELRPSAAEVVERLQNIRNSYRENPATWDEVIPPEAKKKGASTSQLKDALVKQQQQKQPQQPMQDQTLKSSTASDHTTNSTNTNTNTNTNTSNNDDNNDSSANVTNTNNTNNSSKSRNTVKKSKNSRSDKDGEV
jgi:serine/threonine protein kinase